MKNKRKYPDQSEDDKTKKKLAKLSKVANLTNQLSRKLRKRLLQSWKAERMPITLLTSLDILS